MPRSVYQHVREEIEMQHAVELCTSVTGGQLHGVFNCSKSYHITHILRSLHLLRITERIEYKLISLTYKVLTTTQPP